MKILHFYELSTVRVLLVVLAIFFTLYTETANSASEPGTVTIVLSAEPTCLDSAQALRSVEGQVPFKNILEPLVDINPVDGSITPRLATSWKQIDSNTWHFFLRKGVKFHDGGDFNAEAVVFNIKRIYNNKIASSTKYRSFREFQAEGKALGSHTIEIKTDRFVPLLLSVVSTLAICSPNTSMELSRNPIGSGPYKFVKWDVGMQIVLERFDGYWGKQPQVKKAVYIWRSESAVRASMVLIGEADLAPNISRQDANRPDMDSGYLNSETTQLRIGGVLEPPLNDRRVRMALNYAVDRSTIRGTILSGDVVPATQIVMPSIFGHNPDLKALPYDPQKAKQLLAEARKDRVPVDKELLLVGRVGHFPGSEELLEAVMTMYKAVGLNVKLKMFETAAVKTYENKPYPPNVGPYIILRQHDNSWGDAMFSVFHNYNCQGASSSMCDKTVDDLTEKAQVATGEERKKLWQAAFKRIHEEFIPDCMLFHMVSHCRVGKRINFKPSLATVNEIHIAEITFKQ